MLGKLIKHDWKAVCKIMFLMNAILILMTILGIISFQTPLWDSDIPQLNILAGIMLVIYYLSLIVVAFASFIYLAVHFYRNLYTDEGYLTHTLPVKPINLLLSKLIVSVSWTIITSIVIITSVLSLMYTVAIKFADYFTISEFTHAINVVMSEIADEVGTPFPVFVLALILLAFVACICSMLMPYGAISIGQLWSNHKVLGSIFSYIGIYIIFQIILSQALLTFTTDFIYESENVTAIDAISFNLPNTIWSTMFMYTGITLAISIILFFISNFIMKRKLNLD